MKRLNEKHEGESPKVTLRMDPSMIKVVDREAKRIDGTQSAALRSLVMRATGAGVTAAVSAAATAQKELADAASAEGTLRRSLRAMEERAEKAEHERDEAIAQRKEADHGAKKTMDAWNQVRKDLDAARTRVIAVTDAHDEMARERDAAIAEVARLKTELDALKTAAIKTAHKIIAETPAEVAEVAEVARETEQPVLAQSDDAAVNDALRVRYRALSIPLRAFVSKHNITRTPFQKWVAGERDMHGETLAKYEAAIRSEE